MTVTIKFRAFLSYSHRDQAWAAWLHSALERYRIDKDLAGRPTPMGPVPKTLRPIFRDREDFSAGHSLTEQMLAALEASQFLVVICSPAAARSPYVNEEIRRFKALGRTERIVALIVDGEPGDAARECFPEALRVKFGPDGAPTGEREEPIAADARPQGDGKELAKQKIVAALLGVGLDDIVRRAERWRRRRNRMWGALAGVVMLLAVAASGSAVYAWHQLKTNEAFLNATLKTATDIVNTAVLQAEKYNMPRIATQELLAKAEGLFDDMAKYGRQTPELRYRKAWMLIQFARNYSILGDTGKQLARATEAHRLFAALAAEYPDEATFQRDYSVALNDVGAVLVTQGKLDEALAGYRDALAIRERLASRDPDNTAWQRDLALSYDKIGEVLEVQGEFDEALESYRASLAIRERLVAADASNTLWQRDVSVSHFNMGDLFKGRGQLDEALEHYRESLAIRERLAAAEPGIAGWQNDIAASQVKVGDVLMVQRKHDEALASYRAALAIRERLAAADPSNADRQHDLSVSNYRVGDILFAKEKLDEALANYRVTLAIIQRLAASDRANTTWQYDLAVSHARIALLQLRQDKRPEALAEFRKARQIMAALVALAPSVAQWKANLAMFDSNIAALEAQPQSAQQ